MPAKSGTPQSDPRPTDPPPRPPGTPVPPAEVPEAKIAEQIRQIAELLADLHRMLGVIDDARAELLPGEHQTRFHNAWIEASAKLRKVTENVVGHSENVRQSANEAHEDSAKYVSRGLLGALGRLKRAICRASIDEFYSWFNPEPRTRDAVQTALLAGARACDAASVVADSVPGADPIVEFVSFTKHLLELGAQRWANRGPAIKEG